jgi:Skp family chaperone for outer membrane proteins
LCAKPFLIEFSDECKLELFHSSHNFALIACASFSYKNLMNDVRLSPNLPYRVSNMAIYRLFLCTTLFASLSGCQSGTSDCPSIPLTNSDKAAEPLPQQLQQQQLALETVQAKLNDVEQRLHNSQQQLAEKTQQLDTFTQDKQAQQLSTQTGAVAALEQQLAEQQQEINRLKTEQHNTANATAAPDTATMPAY